MADLPTPEEIEAARPRLNPNVTSLGALRPVGETGRTFGPAGVEGPTTLARHRPVEHIFRMAVATGMVGPHKDDDYAVLDCYDDNLDIIEDWGIRDARGFRFLYRKLGWRQNPTTRHDAEEAQ